MSRIDPRHIELRFPVERGGGEWTLLAAGDFCAQGRFERGVGPDESVAWEIGELIATADIAVVNLEGPIRSDAPPRPKSGPPVAVDAESPEVLRRLDFAVAALANNHIMDYGAEGLKLTLEGCREAGLWVCGAGADEAEAMAPVELEMPGDVRLSIFSFCEREFGAAGPDAYGSAWIGHPDALAKVVDAAARGDVVVVIAHGGVEEIPLPPVQRQMQLRAFVDAGARLVVGHHPHVPQGWEEYGGGCILYSLGNFLFDYPEGLRYPKTEWGLLATARFAGHELAAVDLTAIEMTPKRSIRVMGDEKRLRPALDHLHEISGILRESGELRACWQELAVHLWRTRYRRWLQRASGVQIGTGNIRANLNGLLRGLRRRIGLGGRAAVPAGLPDLGDPLMLLNLIRNESHRWAIETALAVQHGDEPDLRTPQVAVRVRELLAWTEE